MLLYLLLVPFALMADSVSMEDKKLFDECTAAHLRLKDAYSHVTMKIKTDSIYAQNTEKELKTKSDLSFWSRGGGYYRLDVNGLEPPRPSVTSLIIPKGFMSFQKQPDDSYRLLTHGTSENLAEGLSQLDSIGFYSSPYSFKGLPRDIWFDINNTSSKLRSKIFQETKDGVRTVVLQIDTLSNNEMRTDFRCRFDRNNMWVMLEGFMVGCDRKGNPTVHMKTNCEYDGVIDGVPRLKKYVTANYLLDGTLEKSQTFNVTEFTFGDPPLSVFDTKQFLPSTDVDRLLRNNDFSWTRGVALSIGVLLIIIGLFLKIRQNRKNSKS
ncbi:MAG: hypothetical protein LBF88_11350 [Planctomycetaceae bacterium]|nr:hypothetical protein [Planctomycetaceae bacterium]